MTTTKLCLLIKSLNIPLGLDVLNKMVNVIAVLPMSPSNSSRTEFPVNSGTSIGCNFSIKKKKKTHYKLQIFKIEYIFALTNLFTIIQDIISIRFTVKIGLYLQNKIFKLNKHRQNVSHMSTKTK